MLKRLGLSSNISANDFFVFNALQNEINFLQNQVSHLSQSLIQHSEQKTSELSRDQQKQHAELLQHILSFRQDMRMMIKVQGESFALVLQDIESKNSGLQQEIDGLQLDIKNVKQCLSRLEKNNRQKFNEIQTQISPMLKRITVELQVGACKGLMMQWFWSLYLLKKLLKFKKNCFLQKMIPAQQSNQIIG